MRASPAATVYVHAANTHGEDWAMKRTHRIKGTWAGNSPERRVKATAARRPSAATSGPGHRPRSARNGQEVCIESRRRGAAGGFAHAVPSFDHVKRSVSIV